MALYLCKNEIVKQAAEEKAKIAQLKWRRLNAVSQSLYPYLAMVYKLAISLFKAYMA